MFTFAILIGTYSYIIFFLGLLGFLYKQTIIAVTLIFILGILFFVRIRFKNYDFKAKIINFVKKSTKPQLFFLSLILIQASVNLIGVLGPELGFDALWYHLTLPKIYLRNHFTEYTPGGLFYYSAMPKLIEMLYISSLAFGSEIIAKFLHFSFGILCLVALYNLSRKFLSKTFSLLTVVLFYSNLVVGWMSITSYIDLARTFFEIMALWGFVEWEEKKNFKWLIESSVMLGLAVSTKLLAIGSIFIFSVLIILYLSKTKKRINKSIVYLFTYWFISLLVPLPWFIFSYIHTGNPFYPFFSNIYPVMLNFNLINPLNLADPISPLYTIFVPIGILFLNKQESKLKIISLYSLLAFLIWQLSPNTGGGRFILPYLPGFSILSIWVITEIRLRKTRYLFIGAIVLLSFLSIIYRLGANSKYVPVIVGNESKSDFLASHLNFSFGDFYDTDGYFTKKIKKEDKVLLYGFHNLYYVNFSFIDSSFVKEGDTFNYIAVQNSDLPKRFSYWNPVYYNPLTKVKLYSLGGQKWIY